MLAISTGHKGANVREVPPQIFINLLARHFEQARVLTMSSWAELIKTGCFKQMPPNFLNWWYMRVAAIAR